MQAVSDVILPHYQIYVILLSAGETGHRSRSPGGVPQKRMKSEVLTMTRKSLLLLLTILLLGTLALAEPEAFFDNVRINDMIDENYALVQQNGWA